MRKIILLWLLLTANSAFAQTDTEKYIREITVEVGVFISPDCPISQKYIARLNTIYLTYRDKPQIRWTFIIPEKLSKKKVQDFAAEFDVKFPLKADDRRRSITRSFGATVTPQVIVKQNKVVYRGAIDNWFYELGHYRQKTTQHYLIDVLESVLRNEDPAIQQTEAIGCPISLTWSSASRNH
jgi:hypothetical protein